MNIERLKEIAGNATPGPWFLVPFDECQTLVFSQTRANGPYVTSVGIYDDDEARLRESNATADFIAEFNPEIVKKLLEGWG